MMYNAVGIDASKGKSTVSIIRPAGVVVREIGARYKYSRFLCNWLNYGSIAYSSRRIYPFSFQLSIFTTYAIVLARHTEMSTELVMAHKAFLYPIQ